MKLPFNIGIEPQQTRGPNPIFESELSPMCERTALLARDDRKVMTTMCGAWCK